MRDFIDSVLTKLLVILMGVMVVNVLWQVFTRFVMQSPSSFTDELARYLLVWVGLLGAAFATGKQLHLAIDIVPSKAGPRSQRVLHVLINLVVAAFAFFVMIVGGINLVYITLTLNQTSAALGLPLGYVYAVLPLSGLLIMYYAFYNILEKPTSAPKEDGQVNQSLT
jgi:TRAP-type C4-dicarboxylate transport system permease small subunit